MRRVLPVFVLALAGTAWLLAAPQKPAATAVGPMLTIDSIMRGPKLIGAAPIAGRFPKDSAKIYFTWQKAGEERSGTFVVNRDGTGLKQLTQDEIRAIEAPLTGRLDRARRR